MSDKVLSQFKKEETDEAVSFTGRKLKIGIIGTGWIAESHVESYKKFDDVESAVRSEKSALSKEIKALVASKATDKDKLHCYGVLKTKGKCAGEPCEGVVVHVGLGLNGPGRDSDYFAALKRLTDTKRFALLDAHVDAVDDLWDFLFVWRNEA